jgi:hypothetical protein
MWVGECEVQRGFRLCATFAIGLRKTTESLGRIGLKTGLVAKTTG